MTMDGRPWPRTLRLPFRAYLGPDRTWGFLGRSRTGTLLPSPAPNRATFTVIAPAGRTLDELHRGLARFFGTGTVFVGSSWGVKRDRPGPRPSAYDACLTVGNLIFFGFPLRCREV